MLFNPQKVRIIKSFSLRGPAKSVWISKNLNYRGSNYTGFPWEFVRRFWGDWGISFELVKVWIIWIRIRESWLYLRVTSEDHKASFEELWEIDNSVSVHFENLHCLATELYKVLNGNLSGWNKRCTSIKQIFQLWYQQQIYLLFNACKFSL